MQGIIVKYKNGYFTVNAPDAPEHLKTMLLRGHEIDASLKHVGAVGVLVYRTTSNSGLWYLTVKPSLSDVATTVPHLLED